MTDLDGIHPARQIAVLPSGKARRAMGRHGRSNEFHVLGIPSANQTSCSYWLYRCVVTASKDDVPL